MICIIFIDSRTVLIVMTISDNVILNKPIKTTFLILHERRNEFIKQTHTIVSVSQESNLRELSEGPSCLLQMSIFPLTPNKPSSSMWVNLLPRRRLHFSQRQANALATELLALSFPHIWRRGLTRTE